jgi:hypothetical protein
MSIEDLEYVEKATGVSLDEDKPLSDIRRKSQIGAAVKKPEYDWFDFFLKAGVGPHQCERYAQNFTRDSMDESVLPDITAENLRTLGLKEGDTLRVMKYLDNQYRNGKSKRNVSFAGDEMIDSDQQGGLFSRPDGTLRNNTRKGRPAPAVQTSDVVDPKAFESKDGSAKPSSPDAASPSPAKEPEGPKGFEDNAWEVKHPKQAAASTPASSAAAAPPAAQPAASQPPLTGAMAELSLLQTPLQPSKASPAPQPAPSQPVLSQPPPQPPQVLPPQPTGASPAFFSQLPGPQQVPQNFVPQMTGYAPLQQQQQQLAMPSRQRPQPPPGMQHGTTLLPPPPQRPLSAPQHPGQQSAFGPPPALQPQLTGLPPQPTGYIPQSQFGSQLLAQHTGMVAQQQLQQQQQQQPQFGFQNLAPQQTGYPGFSQPMPQQAMPGSINSILPPPLQPQPTGINGFGGPVASFTPSPPPIPQQPTVQPLLPQKTGPPPPVRFGVRAEPKKLTPQPTGMRANLSQASKYLGTVVAPGLATVTNNGLSSGKPLWILVYRRFFLRMHLQRLSFGFTESLPASFV